MATKKKGALPRLNTPTASSVRAEVTGAPLFIWAQKYKYQHTILKTCCDFGITIDTLTILFTFSSLGSSGKALNTIR